MQKSNIIIISIVLVLLIAIIGYFTLSTPTTANGEIVITDMVGRTVSIPAQPEKIVSTSGTLTTILYMIAPDKLSALSSDFNNVSYVPDKYRKLPVIGAWHGHGDGNDEALLSLNPDLIIDSPRVRDGVVVQSDLDLIIKKFSPIPVIAVPETANITNIGDTYDFLGKVYGGDSKASLLKDTLNRYLDLGNQNKEKTKDNPVKVYYAQSGDGLTTSPAGSEHAQILDIIGADNVAKDTGTQAGTFTVSIEQVIKWNPDVIITIDSNFYNGIYSNSQWKDINAVKNKKVYLVPEDPYNWFDMPPGSNLIIGIPWALKVVYPEQNTNLDMKKELKEFYSNFYHYDLTDGDVNDILGGSGLKIINMTDT
ncbi:MAG: ABC transporter substrate-binding protein [Methanobrevibacter sp.]|jgi:iron complex transport system substrate-binding protein|nr:ABC transporter substrate-binding protein [Candidatus Methanoflexus mossambicus]